MTVTSGRGGRKSGGASRPARGTHQANSVVAPAELQPGSVALVVGAEALLAERALTAVVARARAADPDVTVENLEAAGYEAGRLALLTSPSLFGNRTVLLVHGVEAANDAFVADVNRYLAEPAPDVCLVLRHSGGQRARGVLDAARKAGAAEVVCQPISKDEDKVEFAANEFRRLGRRASPQAIRALVDAVGSDLRELAAACGQLAVDSEASGDGRIEADLVELWFGGRVEVTGFRVADAAVAGRADQALSLLRHALATGADPVPLVAALAGKIRALAKVSTAGRVRSAEVAGDLGMAPWQVDRARRELAGWSELGLARAIQVVAEADTAVKGGGRDPVFAVERAVLAIARLRGS